MNHKIFIITLLCAIILVSGCTSTHSTNSSVSNNTTTNIAKINLDSKNTSNTIPLKMTPGTKYSVSVTMKNMGIQSWLSNNITLCLANDSSNEAAIFTNNTTCFFMTSKNVTKYGYNYTWSFTITAPTYPNNYTLMFQMMANNTTWFGDKLSVNITDGAYYGPVTFVSVNIPTSMQRGVNYTTSITVQNTGKQPWLESDHVALGAVDYEKNNVSWFDGNLRYYLNPGSSVALGKQCTWKFWLIAPKDPGTYQLKYRMVTGNNSWFGNVISINVTVK